VVPGLKPWAWRAFNAGGEEAGLSSVEPSPVLEYRGAPQATRVRYVVMAFLCALAFLTYFDRVCIMRAAGDIERDLRISDTQMGVIFGAFWLSYAMFELPGGWLGDRFGARGALTRVVVMWSLFTGLSGAAVGFWSLLTFRFIFGAGEAGGYPNIARVQSRWLPASVQGRASGVLWMISRWGGALSPMLFGALMRGIGSPHFRGVLRGSGLAWMAGLPAWRMAFWACGLIGAVWAVLFYPWFRDDPAEKGSVNAAELEKIRAGRSAAAGHGHSMPAEVWKKLFTNRTMWGLAGVYIFGSFGWSFFVSWMPKFLLKVHHVDYAKSEWIAALPMLCGGAMSMVGGYASDAIIRRTRRRWLGRAIFPIAGSIVAAASMLALPYVHTTAQAVVLMCVALGAYDMGLGAKWAAIVEVGGKYPGIAAGFVNMMGNVGNFVQPVVGAMIFGRLGWGTLFVVYAGAYVLSAVMWAIIDVDETFEGEAREA